MTNFAERIAALPPEKRKLLLSQLNQEKATKPVAQPIRPRSRETNSFPVSASQKPLLVMDQFDPGTPTYNIPITIRINGSLDTVILKNCLNEIVQRHETLRTNFFIRDGQPIQEIVSTVSLSLPITDLETISALDREAEMLRIASEEIRQPFDLAQDLKLRAKLLRLGPAEHVLILTMHHIASDGWSNSIFLRELGILYDAFASGKASPLPDLPVQYIDYSHWQQQRLQGDVLETLLAYWKQQLDTEASVLELPTDQPRPPVQSSRGDRHPITLSPELSESLKLLSRQEGVTLFMTLLAAFQTLLYRYTGQVDISVGSPIANRSQPEIENLIGYFSNALVMRTDLAGNPTFRELLQRVRRIALEAYEHQELPFDKLVEELRPGRHLSHSPLFQVMFVLQNTPERVLELPDVTLTPLLDVHTNTSKFDLYLALTESPAGLTGALEYSTDLFNRATITRMVDHFQTLLSSIVSNPEQSISTLPILREAERHQLLVEWNNTGVEQVEPNQSLCIHQLFEAQVERTPQALAVTLEDQQLTYQELNQRANQLAHYLQTLGVGPDVRIGICVERSLEMIVGLLGILKAGGAYIPLDPNYPSERLAFMLEDGQVPVLLTQARLITRLPDTQAKIVCLDADWDVIAQERSDNPISEVSAHNLAYLIYTSGSTGQPKGVMIEHRSLVAYTETASVEFALGPEDRVLQFASISFDTSAEEIYPCLTRGGTLVLRTDVMLGSASLFLEKCREWQLTVLDLPTAYWHELTASLSREALTIPENLRLVIIGGEKALPESLKTWQAHVGEHIRLINTYGPTEGTIVATMSDLSEPAAANGSSPEVPIGRPIRNVQAYVLDRNLQPVPIGVPGELHLGGVGLARGYLNRPELTAEKFIRNPFSDDPQARLYKTGDLVRYLPDSTLEFMGRVDHQVKIRGFRVEVEEIESVLNQHPDVLETVVAVRKDVPGQKRLVAYLVTDPTSTPATSELRDFLKQNVPDYMVPSAFVLLDKLPLTPNGKLDRKALPAPDQNRPELQATFVGPRTPMETLIAEIWQELLNVNQISVQDNFFDLGGDSLLSMRVVAKLDKAIGVQINPGELIFQTLEQLAASCEERTEPGQQSEPKSLTQRLFNPIRRALLTR